MNRKQTTILRFYGEKPNGSFKLVERRNNGLLVNCVPGFLILIQECSRLDHFDG